MGVALVGETPSLTGEFVGETHRVLECTQTHPPRNQHLKRHNLLVGSRGADRKHGKNGASGIVPSLNPSPQTAPQCNKEGCPTLANTQGSATYILTCVLRQRNMAQMKDQVKTPEKKNP